MHRHISGGVLRAQQTFWPSVCATRLSDMDVRRVKCVALTWELFCPVSVSQHSLAACELSTSAYAHLPQDKMQPSRGNPLWRRFWRNLTKERNEGYSAVIKHAFQSMSFHGPSFARQCSAQVVVHLPSQGDLYCNSESRNKLFSGGSRDCVWIWGIFPLKALWKCSAWEWLSWKRNS